MAKIKCKGTALKQQIGNTYTTIAQVTGLSRDGMEAETVETDTLDNASAGIPKSPTGRTKCGNAKAEILYDAADNSHKAFFALLTTPVTTNFQIVRSDNTNTIMSVAGVGFSEDVKMGDYVRGTLTMEMADLPGS